MRAATATAAGRLETPSLPRILLIWVVAVRALIDNAPVFLLIVRLSDGVILECNPRCEELFRCTVASLVGQSVHHLYYAEAPDRERFTGTLARDGRVRRLDIEFQRADGTRFAGWISAEYLG